MKAGRELDAKVAGELFGWKKDHWDWEFSLPHYSTSIAAAWLVVEKMEELYGFKGHNGFLITKVADKYYVEFPLPNWQDGESKLLPEAICLAALKAKENKNE